MEAMMVNKTSASDSFIHRRVFLHQNTPLLLHQRAMSQSYGAQACDWDPISARPQASTPRCSKLLAELEVYI